MLRVISTHLVQEVSERFHYTDIDSRTTGPRDVLWTRPEVAFRVRMEQIAELKKTDPSSYSTDNRTLLCPFMSVYRTRVMVSKDRINYAAASSGAKWERDDTLKIFQKYKMLPVDLGYEIHHYSTEPDEAENATEDYIRWVAPPSPQLNFTDTNEVEFKLPIIFEDPITVDDPELARQYEIGVLYHTVYGLTIRGWVVESPDVEIKTVLSIKISLWDNSSSGGASGLLLETHTIS